MAETNMACETRFACGVDSGKTCYQLFQLPESVNYVNEVFIDVFPNSRYAGIFNHHKMQFICHMHDESHLGKVQR